MYRHRVCEVCCQVRRDAPKVDANEGEVPLPEAHRTPACGVAAAAVAADPSLRAAARHRRHRHALRTSLIPEFCRPLGKAKWMFVGLVAPAVIWRVQSLLIAVEVRSAVDHLLGSFHAQSGQGPGGESATDGRAEQAQSERQQPVTSTTTATSTSTDLPTATATATGTAIPIAIHCSCS